MAYSNIKDPSAHFYSYAFSKSSGTGSATFDGNSDLQPDFLWVKSRTNADSHEVWDSTRGVNSTVFPDNTSAQDTSANRIVSFDTDGFTWGNAGNLNAAGNFVSWAWKCNGGTTSNNTDGTITTSVQVNQDAGFSIGTYTGNGNSSVSIGHGLGAIPDFFMIKGYSGGGTKYWVVGCPNTAAFGNGGSNHVFLDTNFAIMSNTTVWRNANFTTTIAPLGNHQAINTASANYMFFAFKNIQGYSKVGQYTGNGSQDGPMVYTGFKPAFVIMKKTDSAGAWHVFDNKRSGYNYANDVIQADVPDAELSGQTYQFVDLLSSGFKVRRATHGPNVSGGTYMYMAFAESPFVTSTGVPTTAR